MEKITSDFEMHIFKLVNENDSLYSTTMRESSALLFDPDVAAVFDAISGLSGQTCATYSHA